MRLCRRLFIWMVLTAFCGTLSDSQDSNNLPLFQSKVRVVLVDVVVTNTKGESVAGLVKNDFEILEEKQPQKISFFEEHKAPTAAPLKLPPMPAGVFTNFPAAQSPDAVNVLLLDWLNTHPRDQSYVRAQVIKYLKEVPAGTRLAVFVLGDNLRMVHRVTTDSAALLTAFENKDETGPIISRLSGTQEDTSGLIVPSPQMTQDAFAMRQSAAAANNAYIGGTRIAVTFEALQRLAKFLSIIPGRKNLLWFSGSFPVTLFPTTDDKTFHAMSQYQKELQLTSDLLTPGQIAIYPIAAQGLEGLPQYGANKADAPTAADNQRVELERAGNQIAMEELARDTGGKAFYNVNGLNDAITHAVNDGSRYYTLAYSPANKVMDGKFRKIQVKLLGDNYKLSYRQGYYADEVPKGSTGKFGDDALMPLLVHGLPDSTQVLYKIHVAPVSTQPDPNADIAGGNTTLKRPVIRYGVDFAIAEQDIKLETTPDGVRHGNIEVAMIAYDRDGTPLNWVIRKPVVALDPKAYVSLEQVGLQLHLEIDVPRGNVFLHSGIYDFGSSKAGTLELPLNDITERK